MTGTVVSLVCLLISGTSAGGKYWWMGSGDAFGDDYQDNQVTGLLRTFTDLFNNILAFSDYYSFSSIIINIKIMDKVSSSLLFKTFIEKTISLC